MIRSEFLAAVSLAPIAGGQTDRSAADLVARKGDFDAAAFHRTLGRDAHTRQVFEAVKVHEQFLNSVKNSVNGLQFGFGYSPASFHVVVAPHGPSSVYTYADYVWEKYRLGEFFGIKDRADSYAKANPFLKMSATRSYDADPDDERGFYQDVSVEALQDRGVTFLTCHTAVEEQARAIIKAGLSAGGETATGVANEILTHLVPGALVVPSMVAALAVLQNSYRFAYTASIS